jgi:RNA ligase
MIQLPPLLAFYKAVEDGRLMSDTSDDGRLVCFKYTEATAANADWDEVTLNARGIVFETATGKIVARPWHKFFNYHELFGDHELAKKTLDAVKKAGLPLDMDGIPVMLDKIDGSLGIVYWYDGKWNVNTGCSFHSPQAMWASRWLNDHMADKEALAPITQSYAINYTHLFEIVWHLDKHPIRYEQDRMVYLGAVETATGQEMRSMGVCAVCALLFGASRPEQFDFSSIDKVAEICKTLPADHEGFVITWPSGFKLKMKGDAYLKLLGFYDKCTDKYMWRAYDPVLNIFHANLDASKGYEYVDDEPLVVPEELTDVKARLERYVKKYSEALSYVISTGDSIATKMPTMAERAKYITTNFSKEQQAPLLSYVRGDKIENVKRIVNKTMMRPEKGASDKNPYIGYHEDTDD